MGKKKKVASKFVLRFDPGVLQIAGPLVKAGWSVPVAHAKQLQRTGKPVPQPVVGAMLIDTGAQSTCIAKHAAETLGLKPIGKMRGFGAGGMHENDRVAARLGIGIENRNVRTQINWELPCQAIPEMENHLPGLELSGTPTKLIGLLGRDILSRATLMYNGKKGTVEVIFDRKWVRKISSV